MEPLVFFGIVLIVAIAIGVFFENFALDVKSGRQRPPTNPPRRPPPSGPGQTKIWRSQLMHAGDKRPKPKPSQDLNLPDSGSSQSSGPGQTKIWRAQKEYRPDGLPKPRPTQGARSSEPDTAQSPGAGPTKIWRAQKEYRPEGLPKPRPNQGLRPSEQTTIQNPRWGETKSGQAQSNRPRKGRADESTQMGRWSQGKAGNDAAGIDPTHRRPNPADRQTPPRAPQRGAQDRPISRPARYSAQRRNPVDPSRPKQPVDESLLDDTHLGFVKKAKSADNRSAKRQYPKASAADEPTRIQFTDRLRPIDQSRKRPGLSRSSNLANDQTANNPFPGRQQPAKPAKKQPSPAESFNPAAYEQTYIGPFLDEEAIAELKREVESPPPDVVYQETFLGPLSDDEVIEEIQEDEIEELALEGDVQPFDATYYDQTFIGPNESLGPPDDKTYIGGLDEPADSPESKPEEDSTLIWRPDADKS